MGLCNFLTIDYSTTACQFALLTHTLYKKDQSNYWNNFAMPNIKTAFSKQCSALHLSMNWYSGIVFSIENPWPHSIITLRSHGRRFSIQYTKKSNHRLYLSTNGFTHKIFPSTCHFRLTKFYSQQLGLHWSCCDRKVW